MCCRDCLSGNVFAGVNGAMTTTVSSAGSQQCLVLVEVITDIARLQVGCGRLETWVIAEDRKFRTCT